MFAVIGTLREVLDGVVSLISRRAMIEEVGNPDGVAPWDESVVNGMSVRWSCLDSITPIASIHAPDGVGTIDAVAVSTHCLERGLGSGFGESPL